MFVAQDLYGGIQFGKLQFALMLGRGPLNQPPVNVDDETAAQEEDDEEESEGQDQGWQGHGLPSGVFHWFSVPKLIEGRRALPRFYHLC